MELRVPDALPPVLHVCGDIRGADIGVFCDALVGVVDQGGQRTLIDLSGVGSWSLVAQAMVLRTARQLRTGGRELVLVAPGAVLVANSAGLDVFGVVETLPCRPTG